MRLASLSLALILAFLPSSLIAQTLSGPRVEVVDEGPSGFTLRIQVPDPVRTTRVLPGGESFLEVSIPGFLPGSAAEPGFPDLPQKGFPFGLPEGTRARIVKSQVTGSESWSGLPPMPVPTRRIVPGNPLPIQEEAFTPRSDAYGSAGLFPAAQTELSPVMGWRHQRIQTLVLHPVQVVPSAGAYQVVREIEVTIRFESTDSGSQRPGARMRVVQDAPGWDEIIDKTLMNPKSARTFRSRPLPRSAAPVVQPGALNLRLRLGGTGFSRIPHADLVLQGWPAEMPVEDVRLQERAFDKGNPSAPFLVHDIPRTIEDTNNDQMFNDGDFLVFYGFNYKDRFNPLVAHARFTYFHSYWLSSSPAGGRDLPEVDGYPAGTYTVLPNFPFPVFEEKNLVYTHNPKDSSGNLFPVFDALYWLESGDRRADLSFRIRDLDPAGSYQVTARWQGKDVVASTREHIVSIDINGQTILDERVFFERFELKWTSPLMPSAGVVTNGSNIFTMRGRTTNPDLRFYGAWFDWYEVSYDRLFIAENDQLIFNSGTDSGNLEFVVTGFTSPDILVLDVTDPLNVTKMNGVIETAGSTWTVKIRGVVSAFQKRTFAAVVTDRVNGLVASPHPSPPDLPDQPIAPGLPRDLLVEGNGSDYILITHPEFEDAWQPLVDHRESLGHRVFVCNVWDIYDQFTGGDKSPWAIQYFLSQAFRTWDPTPSFVLMGGDASEDYRTDTDESDPDYVPTMMHFANVQGAAGRELAGTDTWYVMFLKEGDLEIDFLMDMHIGRLPVGSVEETQAMVQKIIDYETMNAGDAWRNRAFILADDQYSNSIHANAPYCYQNAESSFRSTSLAVCDSIRVLGKLPNFTCDTYFLADHLDTVEVARRNPGLNDCPINPSNGTPNLVNTRNYTRANFTPQVLDSLSQGHLIWQFTGHANKNLITHEAIIEHNPAFLSVRDLDKINNIGKPFLFMGFACHLIEFEGAREKSRGESIGDILLNAPNRGAVAVFASTGFEWLHTNPIIQMRTTRPLFWDLPRNPDGRPRRLFGEAMSRGLIQLAMEEPGRPDFTGMLRTYQTFSDPALRIDVNVSTFDVRVDGTAWADGDPITAPSANDSILVEATISDDVDVSSIKVSEGGVELPASRVSITPPGVGEQGSQFYQAQFKSALALGSYDIRIEAQDWAGRSSSFVIPVTLATNFKADGILLDPDGQNNVDVSSVLEIEVLSPVPLTAANFQVMVDGEVSSPVLTELSPTQWTVGVGNLWDRGTHTVDLLLEQAGTECIPAPCALRRTVSFTASDAAIAIQSMYFYPNPTETPAGVLTYSLNRRAISGTMTVYSVSGRRVLKRDLDPSAVRPPQLRAGVNSVSWNLKDQAGDDVANGIYLVVLTLTDIDGQRATTRSIPEKVVVTR